jgi:hypothetical protein
MLSFDIDITRKMADREVEFCEKVEQTPDNEQDDTPNYERTNNRLHVTTILAGSARYTPPLNVRRQLWWLRDPAACGRESPVAAGRARPHP